MGRVCVAGEFAVKDKLAQNAIIAPPRVNERADRNVQEFSYPTATIRSLGADRGALRRSWLKASRRNKPV
jgi:hypothetical protein